MLCSAHFFDIRDCCKYSTGPNPFYSNMGTCFTINVNLAEDTAHSSSNVRLLMMQNSSDLPEFEYAYKVVYCK